MIAAILGTFAGVLALLVAAMWVGIDTPEPAGAHHKPRPGLRQRYRDRRQAERDSDEATERLFSGMQVPPEIARDAMPTGILHYDGPDLTPGQLREFGRGLAAAGPLMPLTQVADDALMPLPPEVDEEPFGLDDEPEPWPDPDPDGFDDEDPWMPADPLAVLGDDACADALVGDTDVSGTGGVTAPDSNGGSATVQRQSAGPETPGRPVCRSGLGHGYDRCPGCDACRGCHPHDPGMGCLPWLAAVPVPRDDYADLAGGQYAEATGQFSVAVLDEYERALVGAVMPKDGA